MNAHPILRDPEAWPVVFCLARIDVEGGNRWPWKKNKKEVNARGG